MSNDHVGSVKKTGRILASKARKRKAVAARALRCFRCGAEGARPVRRDYDLPGEFKFNFCRGCLA